MFKNYLLTAVRHLTRHKSFALINLVCLAIGLCFSLVIMVYVVQEKGVNKDLKNHDRHFLLKSEWKNPGMGIEFGTFGPMAKTLKEEYPSLVKSYFRYSPVTNIISANERFFKEDIAICDTTLVSMYGFPVLYGNKEKAFSDLHSAVITETMAMKLFDRKDVINEVIGMNTTGGEKQDYKITAVVKDYAYNSVTGIIDRGYSVFVPAETSRYYVNGDPTVGWTSPNEVSFVELQPGVNAAALDKPFSELLQKYLPKGIEDVLKMKAAPVEDYYLQSNNGRRRQLLNILAIAALFILIMAVINFININTGAAAYRSKEIGVRKVLGGSKMAIALQYMTEALLITCVAAVIALVGYELLFKISGRLLHTDLPHIWQLTGMEAGLLAGLVLLIGLLSGVYPAFVLSNVNTVLSVKGKAGATWGSIVLRKGLLIVQFTVAIVVFISTIVITNQVRYCFNKDLGYSKDQLLVVYAMPKQWDVAGVKRMETVKQELLKNPAVQSASLTGDLPDARPYQPISFTPPGGDPQQPVVINSFSTDETYASTIGLQMKEGQFFTSSASDYVPGQIVLNETAIKALGITDPVNKEIVTNWGRLKIKGVVKDYHYANLNEKIAPVCFTHINDNFLYRFMAVKLHGNTQTALESVKDTWNKMLPQSPFEFYFMDDKFQDLYRSELQLKGSSELATLLNVVIVLLGIFGVVSFAIVKRTREMAVRKVLGADTLNIIVLFLKEYIVVFAVANLLAWPVAYYFSSQWLQQYVYRVPGSVFPFVLATGSMLMVAVMLVVFQCLRVAQANPTNSLRGE